MEAMLGHTKYKTTESGIEYWLDNETGEVKQVIDPNRFTVTSNEQREAYKRILEREHAINNGRSKNWVACYHDAVKSLSSKLTLEEMGAVFLLIPYMNLKRKGKLTMKGNRMNVNSIAKAIGKSVSQTKRLLPRLVETGVLYKEREGKSFVYGVSSEYHTIGGVNDGYFNKRKKKGSLNQMLK